MDILATLAYLLGQKQKMDICRLSSDKVGFNILCGRDLFPLFIPSIPKFHYSIIPCGLPTRAATKTTIFLTSCKNSETVNY